jgi:hypothetical protein
MAPEIYDYKGFTNVDELTQVSNIDNNEPLTDIPQEYKREGISCDPNIKGSKEYFNRPRNVIKFDMLLGNMYETYKKKNHDYGNSFDESLDKFGLVASAVRLSDKLNRFNNLINKENQVDESIRDTLLDAANYCVMTVMWLDKQQ